MSAVTWDTAGGWDTRVAGLAADVDRVADRLRSLSDARLHSPVPGHDTRADAARAAAQALVEVAQGVEEGPADVAPPWRDLPRLGDFAVGDQVAVAGHDVAAACAAAGPDGPGWARSGRRTTAAVLLVRATDVVRQLRAVL